MQLAVPTRIVILARPDLAREVEAFLSGAGHEIYRTPDAAGVSSLVARIRPHLVIIAQDIPWADAAETPYTLASRLRAVPVLVIGDVNSSKHVDGLPYLPLPIDHAVLQLMVAELLGDVQRASP